MEKMSPLTISLRPLPRLSVISRSTVGQLRSTLVVVIMMIMMMVMIKIMMIVM